MDKTTERIKADAQKAVKVKDWGESLQIEMYIAGATAENERAQKLVDVIEVVRRKLHWMDNDEERELLKVAVEQWSGNEGEKFEGSVFQQPAAGITLGCISPEARDLLDTIMEEWEKHFAGMKEMHGDAMPETTFYGFAYWLVRWSGLIQPSINNSPQNKSK